jgi:geranylgeranyl diphosphate synthase, type III
MVLEGLRAPSLIPPRTSSVYHPAPKPVVDPGPESPSKRRRHTMNFSNASPAPAECSEQTDDSMVHETGPTWSADKEKILFGPYDYLFAHPGKDIRSQLITAFNAWLKVPEESLKVITKVVGMLHTASLV